MNPRAQRVSPHIARQRIYQWSMALAVVGMSTYLINVFSVQGMFGVMVFMAPIAVGLWAYWARERWWVLLPIATSFGGVFYFGFRIYVYEMALAACILGLMPVLAVTKMRSARPDRVPLSVYLLTGYLLVHLGVSEYIWYSQVGRSGVGNILRVYVRALWPLIFLIVFYLYGNTKYLKMVLVGMYAGSALRVGLGVAGYLAPQLLYIPFVNLVLPGIWSQGIDLRSSALTLVSLSLCFGSMTKNRPIRYLHFTTVPLALWLVLLGGSRTSLGVLVAILLLWALFQRKFILLTTLSFSFMCALIVFNANPRLVYRFPTRAQRTLSILVLKSDTQTIRAHQVVEASNRWHFDLMRRGMNRWLASPVSFLFGNRIHGFDHATFYGRSSTTAQRTELAVRMGSFESALWTILAVLGTTGAVLYVMVGCSVLRGGMIGALVRDGIADPAHSFYFLSVSGLIVWAVFSWVAGHFPGTELMLAAIARAAYADARAKRDSERTVADPTSSAANV